MSFTNFKGQGFGAGEIFANRVINVTAIIDPVSLVDGAGESIGVAAAGVAIGDFVLVSPGADILGTTFSAYAMAPDVIQVRIQNQTGGTVDIASSTWKFKVLKDGL